MDIPLDLQIETLLRLPVKSLLRFRCVSKLWFSIITSRDFRNRHSNIASSSAPTPFYIDFIECLSGSKYPNVSYSSYKDMSMVIIRGTLLNAVRGLICFRSMPSRVAICNPSTRQFRIFPHIEFSMDPDIGLPNYFLGYDSVNGEYKVLAIDGLPWRSEHKVVVLGGEKAWRDAPWGACRHCACTTGLYMNGNLYYGASRKDINYPNNSIIMSFNVTLETFNIIKVPTNVLPVDYNNMWATYVYARTDKTLINYGGKIGVVENPREGSFRMWVVEDAEKEEWSVNTYHLPQSVAGIEFNVMKTFYNGEICLVPKTYYNGKTGKVTLIFSYFYYNLKTKSMRSVLVEGLPEVTVSDHYENLMFL